MLEPAGANPPAVGAFALWNLGFRPFFLLASIFAALSIALWVCQYTGALPFTYVVDARWHGSEMLFGYATAVITGFLLTAVRNWTGRPTLSGRGLAALAALWVAGRLFIVGWPVAAAWTNAAFPMAAAAAVAVPLVRAGNRRNYLLVVPLVLLGGAAAALHLSYFGIVDWPARASLQVGLDAVTLIMAAIAGRVVPMFTSNGVPGATPRRSATLDKVALSGIVVLLAADVALAPPIVVAALAGALAVLHGVRLLLWQPWRTLHVPMVWILHAAYAWIVAHFALRALAVLDVVPSPLALHALTIGGIGGLTIAMMTRTARGHTGRPLRADHADLACYLLVMAAAVFRVVGPYFWPSHYVATVVAAGACWTVAFAFYAIRYAPSLVRARLDGKAG